MTPCELRVRRVSHRGHVVEWVLNPLWVQLDHKADANSASSAVSGLPRPPRVDRELFGPDEKASFAKALLAALQAAKRGPTYNPVS